MNFQLPSMRMLFPVDQKDNALVFLHMQERMAGTNLRMSVCKKYMLLFILSLIDCVLAAAENNFQICPKMLKCSFFALEKNMLLLRAKQDEDNTLKRYSNDNIRMV